MVDILIENAHFLVCDAKTVIEDGAIAIEGDRIVDVGKTADLKKKYRTDRRIDAKWKVVMPGLVDCHAHGAENLFRGLGYELLTKRGHSRYIEMVAPGQFFFNKKNTHLFYLMTYADMIRSGTTCCLDMYFYPDVMCEAAHESGLRVNAAAYVFDLKPKESELARMKRFMDASNPEEQLKNIEFAIQKWHGADNDRIRLMYGPHTIFDNSPEHLQKIRELATKHGLNIHIHLNEDLSEIKQSIELFGKRPIEHVNDLGLLGPDVSGAHCIWISNAEKRILAQNQTKVVHDPKSNMLQGQGVAPIPELLGMGVTVGLGSNGTGHSAEVDMFTNMKLASILQKLDKLDETVMPAQTVFDMATMGGAKNVAPRERNWINRKRQES